MALRAVKFSLNLSPETQVPKPVENPIDADVTNVSAIAAPAIFKSCAKIFEVEPTADVLKADMPVPTLKAYF